VVTVQPEPIKEMSVYEALPSRHRHDLWLPFQIITLTLPDTDRVHTAHRIIHCPQTGLYGDAVVNFHEGRKKHGAVSNCLSQAGA
jgi:hypothetical protein